MKSSFWPIAVLSILFLIACKKDQKQELIPVNYDFDTLNIHLNESIKNNASKVEWKWDHMSSDTGAPDSLGVDYYMNIDQPSFFYNGEETLPSLSVTTERNKIIDFSATIIFRLDNNNPNSIQELFEELDMFDLLKNEKVKQAIIDDKVYKVSNSVSEEMIILKLSESQYGYDRMTYSIKIN